MQWNLYKSDNGLGKGWNPVTGCKKYSLGCANCYAEHMAEGFLKRTGAYQSGFELTFREERLEVPARRKKGSTFFVCDMADLFQKDIPTSYIDRIWDVMIDNPQHIYQLLTKRSKRLEEYFKGKSVPINIWIGVTIEHRKYMHRLNHLNQIDAPVKYLMCEPLLSDLPELDLRGISWVMVGGESGPNCRPCDKDWVRGIRDQSFDQGVPFKFKGFSARSQNEKYPVLDSRIHKAYPSGPWE